MNTAVLLLKTRGKILQPNNEVIMIFFDEKLKDHNKMSAKKNLISQAQLNSALG